MLYGTMCYYPNGSLVLIHGIVRTRLGIILKSWMINSTTRIYRMLRDDGKVIEDYDHGGIYWKIIT